MLDLFTMTSNQLTTVLCVGVLVASAIVLQGCGSSTAQSSGSGRIGDCTLTQTVTVNGAEATIAAKLRCTKGYLFLQDQDGEDDSSAEHNASAVHESATAAGHNASAVHESAASLNIKDHNASVAELDESATKSRRRGSVKVYVNKNVNHRRRVSRDDRVCRVVNPSDVSCPTGTVPNAPYISGISTRCTSSGATRLVEACSGAKLAFVQTHTEASHIEEEATQHHKFIKKSSTGHVGITAQ